MAEPDGMVLEARGLTRRYASIPAVDRIHFTIGAHDILGCLGPNGAGKSTTVKMLAGLVEPSSGKVLFHGRNIWDDLASYKRHLGYVPEQAELYSFLTGWEYIELVATLRGFSHRRFEEKASALLQEFSLYPHRHSLIGSYSKGMRQRIVLISALIHNPEVLILDEPFTGLDVSSVLVVRKVIELLAREGKAIFFSSPVLEVMEKLCTRILLLKDGCVVTSASSDEIPEKFARGDLESVFLHLTEEVDADQIARNIVAAVAEPVA
jgi:ABC-2 type transport system ATP-binding protein